MDTDSNRDTLMRLFDAGRVNGVAYLLAIIALGGATIADLCQLSDEHDQTVRKYLKRLETRGFVTIIRDGRGDRYMPAPQAASLFAPRLLTKFSYAPSSSSSSDQIKSDQDQIRSESEEEVRHVKISLNRYYGFTGQKAAALLDNAAIKPLTIVAWMCRVKEMKRNGFKFNQSPEAYALACLLRPKGPDEPPLDALKQAPSMLDFILEDNDNKGKEDRKTTDDVAQDTFDADWAEFLAKNTAISSVRDEIARLEAEIQIVYSDDKRASLIAQRNAAYRHWQNLIDEDDVKGAS